MQDLSEIAGEIALSALLMGLLVLGNRMWRQENGKYLHSCEDRQESAKRVGRIRLILYLIAPLCAVPLSLALLLYVIPQVPVLSVALGGASGAIFAIWLAKKCKDLKWEGLFPPTRSPSALVKLVALGFLAFSAVVLLYPAATDPVVREKVKAYFSENKGEKH
jgi:hypothetical protein